MILIPVALSVAAFLPQGQPARQPAGQQPAAAHQAPAVPQATPPASHPNVAQDTSFYTLRDISAKVARLRSTYELYRRAVFNGPDGLVIDRAGMFETSCRDLAGSVRQGRRMICASCMARNIQPVIDQYRAYLPSLQTLAEACATRMHTLGTRGDQGTRGAALRAEVHPVWTPLALNLRTYEARLHDVMMRMGWATPVVAQPPPPRH